ncbi:hypothetical protein BaRGS_00035292, partial [Batillaria attramentaria]
NSFRSTGGKNEGKIGDQTIMTQAMVSKLSKISTNAEATTQPSNTSEAAMMKFVAPNP